MLTVFGLLCLTIGVATLRVPVRGAEDGPLPVAKTVVAAAEAGHPPMSSEVPYVREGKDGVAVLRPAAAFRHAGMAPLLTVINAGLGEGLSMLAKQLKIDTSRPDFLKLHIQDIEWVSTGIDLGWSPPQNAKTKDHSSTGKEDPPLHRIAFGTPTVRMVAPFDWLAFLRQWGFEFEEVRVKDHAYFKVSGEIKKILGKNPCVFLADDRTIVVDEEDGIRRIAGGEEPSPPDYLRGKTWERASRGLVAIAVNNRDGKFAKRYDLGRPDDAIVLSLFKGVDSWILGVDDADTIALHAEADCRDRDAVEAARRALDSLITLGRLTLEHAAPKSPAGGSEDQEVRMAKALLTGIRVEHSDKAITVAAQGFGSLADFASIIEAQARENGELATNKKDATTSVKR